MADDAATVQPAAQLRYRKSLGRDVFDVLRMSSSKMTEPMEKQVATLCLGLLREEIVRDKR